jgi:thiamine pyrophosphokinase
VSELPETVVVFAGGPRPDPRVLGALPDQAEIIAADRGAEHALRLGLRPALVVGDFVSIGAATLARLERDGVPLAAHPANKDATDLALALRAAAARAPRRIVVVGSAAGRLDHVLGGFAALAADELAGFDVDALLGHATVHVVRRERRIAGRVREIVSLFALRGDARGVVSDGLVYPLRDEVLAGGSTRGVSNIFASAEVRIALEDGLLLVVRPGGLASLAVFRNAQSSVAAGSVSS